MLGLRGAATTTTTRSFSRFSRSSSLRAAASMPTEKALTFVKDKIASNKVVVFSKSHCPYCIKAKQALGTLLKPDQIAVVEIDHMTGGEGISVQDALGEITGGRTVPRVFVGGKFIGGGDDTAAKQASGELARLLQAVGLP